MFFSSKLKKIKNLNHCFFSRKGGFSKGLYEGLNCGQGSNDKKKDILKNREFVSNKMGCRKSSLVTLNQVHSDKVIYLKNNKILKSKFTGDSIVTKSKNIGIGVLTADCAPILFYDPNKKIIGCAHSGWKGALNGIIKNTVKKFNQLNSNNSDLIAVVGPCIDRKNYQVEKDLLEKFYSQDNSNKKFFKKIKNKKYTFDLRGYINKEISNLNIKNIENVELDTFSNPELFYSYRKSLLSKDKDYGRCISVILMT